MKVFSMTFQKGDTVTQRGVWLPATVTQVGPQVIEVRWQDHAKLGFPERSFIPLHDVLSMDAALAEIAGNEIVVTWQENMGPDSRFT